MTLADIRKLPLLQTRTIAEACKDSATLEYVISCVDRFYNGDYGDICQEDTEYNNADLEAGDGHILARYGGGFALAGDIYIEAHFYEPMLEDINYSHVMIMYPDER